MNINLRGVKFLGTASELIQRKKRCCCMSTSRKTRRIRKFHVVIMQWRQRHLIKSLVLWLLSPCTAFFQTLSVNSLRWRIRGERAGNASHFRLHQVTRNALDERNNVAYRLRKCSGKMVVLLIIFPLPSLWWLLKPGLRTNREIFCSQSQSKSLQKKHSNS